MIPLGPRYSALDCWHPRSRTRNSGTNLAGLGFQKLSISVEFISQTNTKGSSLRTSRQKLFDLFDLRNQTKPIVSRLDNNIRTIDWKWCLSPFIAGSPAPLVHQLVRLPDADDVQIKAGCLEYFNRAQSFLMVPPEG